MSAAFKESPRYLHIKGAQFISNVDTIIMPGEYADPQALPQLQAAYPKATVEINDTPPPAAQPENPSLCWC